MCLHGLQNLGPTEKSVNCAATKYMKQLLTLQIEGQHYHYNLANPELVPTLNFADI